MKKIVFISLVMKKNLNKLVYKADKDTSLEYDEPVYFPVNAVLGKSLKKGDDVKVVLMKIKDFEGNTDKNEEIFKDELLTINKNIGANIEFKTIESPFIETYDTHEKMIRKIVAEFEQDAEIITDITYGPKPQAIVMFASLKFAEKFYQADIKNIIYGKVDFKTLDNGKTEPINPVMYDLSSLYYLSSIFDSLEDGMSAEKALSTLDILLKI